MLVSLWEYTDLIKIIKFSDVFKIKKPSLLATSAIFTQYLIIIRNNQTRSEPYLHIAYIKISFIPIILFIVWSHKTGLSFANLVVNIVVNVPKNYLYLQILLLLEEIEMSQELNTDYSYS
jgi:hypothetical protein